jgi:hypothetical protein
MITTRLRPDPLTLTCMLRCLHNQDIVKCPHQYLSCVVCASGEKEFTRLLDLQPLSEAMGYCKVRGQPCISWKEAAQSRTLHVMLAQCRVGCRLLVGCCRHIVAPRLHQVDDGLMYPTWAVLPT